MNKYIVATENENVTVNADGLEIREDGLLVFYVNPDGENCGRSTAAVEVALFKDYRHFILSGKEDGSKFSIEGVTHTPDSPTKEKEPWSIPQKDVSTPKNKKLSYGRVFDHLDNGKPVELVLENEQGVKNTGYCYLRDRGNNIDPHTGDNVMISVGLSHHSPRTWAYYDKNGNLEKAEIF